MMDAEEFAPDLDFPARIQTGYYLSGASSLCGRRAKKLIR
jgi:hypothetical protein